MYATVPGIQKYGPWEYNAEQHTLYCSGFEFDLTECSDCPKTLNLIFEIAEKSWADQNVIFGLIMAMRAILHPQARLCAGGVEKGALADRGV